MEPKKLTRVEDGKMIAGVCNGIAKYFNLDVTLIRLAWILLVFMAGTGILAYFIAMIIMPAE